MHRARNDAPPSSGVSGGHVISRPRTRPDRSHAPPLRLRIAMNGAALVHDFEDRSCGNTSEDVEAGLGAGQFGKSSETGEYINEVFKTRCPTPHGLRRGGRPIPD